MVIFWRMESKYIITISFCRSFERIPEVLSGVYMEWNVANYALQINLSWNDLYVNIAIYTCFYTKVEYISKEMDGKNIENTAWFS